MDTTCLWLAAAILPFGLAAGAADTVRTTNPARNADPSPGSPGPPPYEMAGRAEERMPLVDFQDLSGWVVEGYDAEGWLVRSEERKLYDRPFVGKLTYVARGERPALLVRPPEPIPIPEPWDCVNAWNWGTTWCWVHDPSTPPLDAAILLRDSQDRELAIPLGSMNYTYWFLMHGRLPASQRAAFAPPFRFAGFRFGNAGNREERTIYLGPCYFYKEDLRPLEFEPWPSRLPFPTRPETILPTQKRRRYRNTAARDGGAVVFRYRAADADIAWRVEPRNGGLADVEVLYGGTSFRPCAGSGLWLAAPGGPVPADDPRVSVTPLSQAFSRGVLTVLQRVEAAGVSADVTWRYRLRQKSLIVEVEASAPVVERVAWGRAEPVSDPRIFRVPYLTYGGNDPHVLFADGLFVFLQCDWFVSNASVLDGGGRIGPGWAVFNGAARYIPMTDGTRNPLRERVFLTVSPDFQEVLPTIPNPASPFREIQGERLWRVRSGADHAAEIADAARLRERGCEKVTVRYHEESWRDGGESFTFRTQAAPGRGGDAALKAFVGAVQALGWRVGLYTNYTDYAPVNALWDEDWVTRTPSGDWLGAWCRCYAPKPMRAVEAEARLAPQIHAKFGENHSYCDVHTAVTPFSRVDYDARVPGAGTFRRTFECFGRLLHNEKTAHDGPVYSEGLNHWWYAGLTDGNYAQIVCPSPPREPLLVDFDLLKMHPLQMDAGMGSPGMFFRGAPASLDQFLATTIAYGHIGFLGEWDLAGDLKCYYMMQQTSKRYAMVPVRRIAYAGEEGRWLDTSQALPAGAVRQGRVRVEYENGTEVTVNGSTEAWSVCCGDRTYVLPPWGYVVRGDGLLTVSATVPAAGPGASAGPRRRVDSCFGDRQFYANSPGGYALLGPIGVEGAAALKWDWGGWHVIPAVRCAEFAFLPQAAGLPRERDVALAGTRQDGSPDGSARVRWSRGMVHIVGMSDDCLRVRVSATRRRAPPALHSPGLVAPIGETVPVTLPRGVALDLAGARWEAGPGVWAAPARLEGRLLRVTVPAAVTPGDRLWLRLPLQGSAAEPLWLDFIAVEPVEVTLAVSGGDLAAPGDSLPAAIEARNNTGRPVELSVALTAAPDGRCRPETLVLTLPPGQAGSAAASVTLPWREGSTALTARVSTPGGERTFARTFTAAWSEPALLDLTSPAAGCTRGFCARGQAEVASGEDAHTEDGSFHPDRMRSGTVEKACLFSHPPYGRHRAGYAFAVFEVPLPAEPPARFDVAIGMRSAEGISPTDGVTFKVLVIDPAGTAHELFSEHYAARAWKPVSVDLAPYAGQRIRLNLIADCGPQDDTTADHALWGEPRIVLQKPHLHAEVRPQE